MRNISVKLNLIAQEIVKNIYISDPFVWQSRTICAILVKNIMGNSPVKLFNIQEEMSFKEKV